MDYKLIYNQLAQILRENGLVWIVDQVQEAIKEGKLTVEEAPTFRSEYSKNVLFDVGRKFRKGAKAKFIKRIDYTDKEKLVLLLNGIYKGIFDAMLIEKTIIEKFLNEKLIAIKFYDGDEVIKKIRREPLSNVNNLLDKREKFRKILEGLR